MLSAKAISREWGNCQNYLSQAQRGVYSSYAESSKRAYSAVPIYDTSGQYRYTYPRTWEKGSISPFDRITWAFGGPEDRRDAGWINVNLWKERGQIRYWELKVPIIPLERNSNTFRQ